MNLREDFAELAKEKRTVIIEDDGSILTHLNLFKDVLSKHKVDLRTIGFQDKIGEIIKQLEEDKPDYILCDGLNGNYLKIYEKLPEKYQGKFALVSNDGHILEEARARGIPAIEKTATLWDSYKKGIEKLRK